jgi:thioredoxin-dependent peroxiredoxin
MHLDEDGSICRALTMSDPNLAPTGTTQACLFRDNYSVLTDSGLSVYGLSTDSPKSNTTFATKQSLLFPLLCDPSAKLIAAIGLKKSPKGTSRGVIVIDKTGKVIAWEQAGPQRTVDVVMEVLPKDGPTSSEAEAAPKVTAKNGVAGGQASVNGQATAEETEQGAQEQVETANTAAEVADSAEKIDKHVELGPST